MDQWRTYGVLAVGLIVAVGAGMVLDGFVTPEAVWGGSVCETSGEILGCYGYPPTGIVVLFIVSTMAVAAVAQGLESTHAAVSERL